MPKKRTDPSLDWLPPRVYKHRENWTYCPKDGGRIKLCAITATKLEVLKRYEQVKDDKEKGVFFKHIIDDFFKSDAFLELSQKTRKDYEGYRKTIASVFGKMRPNAIAAHHVRLFMDKLAKTRGKNGKPANSTANRHKACLQKICSWAYQYGKLKQNPCVGVSKLHEKARDKYISDQEYDAVLKFAHPACQAAMEISYLCMARIGDVISLTEKDILEEGIFIEQGKTGKKQIKSWSPRLRAAVNKARGLPLNKGMCTIFLFHKTDGSPYAKRTIQMQFEKARKESGLSGFTFHDLKAKGISDFDGTLADKKHAAGHTTEQQTRSYDRKVSVVKPVK